MAEPSIDELLFEVEVADYERRREDARRMYECFQSEAEGLEHKAHLARETADQIAEKWDL